jgi:hypothetical protein
MPSMLDAVRAAAHKVRKLWHLLVLFLILRLLAGIVMIIFDGGIARSLELTVIIAAAVLVYGLVALAVRQWAPPRRV